MHRLMTKQDRQMAKAAMVAGKIKVQPKGLDCEFYLYERAGKPYAMCFKGTAGRPYWHHSYKSPEAREAHMKREIESFQSVADYKARIKAEHEGGCKIEVGQILVTCWGYDQTNREFFKVIERRGKSTVIVQELAQDRTETGFMSGNATARDEFLPKSVPLTIRPHGNKIKVEGHYAQVWDGKPVGWTSYA